MVAKLQFSSFSFSQLRLISLFPRYPAGKGNDAKSNQSICSSLFLATQKVAAPEPAAGGQRAGVRFSPRGPARACDRSARVRCRAAPRAPGRAAGETAVVRRAGPVPRSFAPDTAGGQGRACVRSCRRGGGASLPGWGGAVWAPRFRSGAACQMRGLDTPLHVPPPLSQETGA